MENRPDWKWQLQNRVNSVEGLTRYLDPTPDEVRAIADTSAVFHFSVTPYYLSLIDPNDPDDPIRRQVIPVPDELDQDIIGAEDPLEEVSHSPVKNLIHNYPDRVAFCVPSECAIYCRFCLRKRMVGDSSFMMKKTELQDAIDYIRATPTIRDVLLTGGDPLILGDRQIEWLLAELHSIPHVEIVRIGTRMPVKLPFRITDDLCRILSKHGPTWLNTHFNHPAELTNEAGTAVDKLLCAGVPVGNQTVLLRGVNDTTDVMRRLCNKLVQFRIRPYYLYQAQLIAGTAHLRTSIESGMQIMQDLQGVMTGFSIPKYVVDTPFGKVPLNRSWVLGRSGDNVIMRTARGTTWAEPNPLSKKEAAEFEAAADGSGNKGCSPLLPSIDMPPGTYSLVGGTVSLAGAAE
jgi:lysine 2,3-aminomutase